MHNNIEGVDLGPARNLSDQATCAYREPLEDEEWPSDSLVEVCACSEDLCNTFNATMNGCITRLMSLKLLGIVFVGLICHGMNGA